MWPYQTNQTDIRASPTEQPNDTSIDHAESSLHSQTDEETDDEDVHDHGWISVCDYKTDNNKYSGRTSLFDRNLLGKSEEEIDGDIEALRPAGCRPKYQTCPNFLTSSYLWHSQMNKIRE